MAKIYEEKVLRFDGAMSDDPRDPDLTHGSLIQHFDVPENRYKLVPHRSTETDENDGSTADGMKTIDVRHFKLGADGKLYGLGENGSSQPKVVSKADPTTGNWTLESNAEGNAARITGCFGEWDNSGTREWWFFQGTNQVAKWPVGGSITNSVATVGSTIVTVAHPVVGTDGNFYMFYNNKVVRVSSAAAVTDNVITGIPNDMRITSVAPFGNYLAIGCAFGTSATATPAGVSKVFIWDMVETATFNDVLDWGEGTLMVLGNIEGNLVGVSDKYLSSALGLTKGSMVVRMWSAGTPLVIKEIVSNQTVTLGRFLQDVVIKNNKMYWVASVPFALSTSTESTFHLGVWAFGRKNVASDFSLWLDFIEPDIDLSNFLIASFGAAGEYFFINHSNDGSIEKTDNAANFTHTSAYETQILNHGNSAVKKKTKGVTVFTAPLPALGQVVLKYRQDAETSYTTIFTHKTDNSMAHSAINIESSGATFPNYNEKQYRIESTGGAEITGWKHQYEIIPDDKYNHGDT